MAKRPLMWDMVYGITGSFIKTKPDNQSGYVRIIYVPLNGLKSKEYPDAIPEENIIRFSPAVSHPGVARDMVLIKEDANGEAPFADKLGERFSERYSDYRTKTENLQIENLGATHRARLAKQDSQKQISIDTELKKGTKKKAPFKRFGGGGFGRSIWERDNEEQGGEESD